MIETPVTCAGARVLVTGGGRGIGATICRRFASAGAFVYVNYSRSERAATSLVSEIVASGGQARAVRANVAQPAQVDDLASQVVADGPLDVLVHNAAIGSFKPLSETRENQWDLTLNVNARALLSLVRRLQDGLATRDGHVISVSSLGGQRVIDRYGAIGVSKAALEATTRYLGVELAPRGIRVNAVAAGLVDDTAVEAHPEYDRMRRQVLDRTPAGRLGHADDVADLVLWLCSPLARWIVGQVIVADGGFSLR
jgi:enoyl-[acyl-carrier protein] reductase III